MKKLLVVLLFLTSSAHAERWFEMPNEAGGKIILTETKCTKGEGKFVIATTPSGTNIHGCWYYFTDMVHIAWENGKSSSFSPNDFTAKERK